MSNLLSPLKIDRLELDNRIVMPPMARSLCNQKGEPNEKLLQHYSKRAEGLGLLIVEHSYVSLRGKLSEGQLGIHKDRLISSLTKLSKAIHSQDTPAAIQINHAGGTTSKKMIGERPVAPSTTYFQNKSVRSLSQEEIYSIKEKFVEAASRANKADFDAIEVHGAHGFLLNQFLSPLTNTRDDKYGGSLEGRMRFPLQIVKNIREVRSEIALLYRLGAVDRKSNGLQLKESKIFAQKLEKAGVDIIDVSGGLCGSRPKDLQGEQGYFVPIAEEIKEAVNVPVIGVGGITDPTYADKIVRENRVDLVAVGRALLRDPKWARKAINMLSS